MSKGSATQNTNSQQTYSANPAISGAGGQALSMAQSAASQPFQTPAAPVAGFSQDQLSAFQNVNNAQGMAQPYFNQAANYTNQSAQPISDSQIANYYNPMAASVTGQLQNIFGQQQRNTTGQLTQAAGGVGADRIAVGQSELANQQGLAAGQVYSGLYNNALSAAQQDSQRQANAGYAMQAAGTGAQNAALQGAGAQLNTGGLQQQLQQAQLMSPYNQQLQQLAYPFQTAQYLAGITGGLAPAFGGTTSGQSQTTSTPAQPSLLSQIAGAGMAGLGLAGGLGAFGGTGKGTQGSNGIGTDVANNGSGIYTGNAAYPGFGATGGSVDKMADGGAIPGQPLTGGVVPDVALHSGGGNHPSMKMPSAPMPQARTVPDYNSMMQLGQSVGKMMRAEGGSVSPFDMGQGFADGGLTQDQFDNRFPAAGDINSGAPFMTNPAGKAAQLRYNAMQDPINASGVAPVQGNAVPAQSQSPFQAMPPTQPGGPALGPQAPGQMAGLPFDSTGDGSELPPESQPTAGMPPAMGGGSNLMPPMPDSQQPYPNAGAQDEGTNFARSPWMALTQAGLATMGGTSPWAGVNIGKGGLEGIKALEAQRKASREEQDVNLKAKQLWQDAQKHLDQYRQPTAYQSAELSQKKALLDKQLEQLKLEGLKPFKIGEDPNTGLDVYGIRDPKTGKMVPIDPNTGEPKAAAAVPTAQSVTKESRPDEPPPMGVPEFKPDLNPTKSTAPTMMKGPFATNEAQTIKNIDAQMSKGRDALNIQRDQLTRMKMDYSTIMNDNDRDGFFKKMLTLPGSDPEKRIAIMRATNQTAMAANQPPPFNPEKVAAMEELVKIQKTMGMSFAATISPRDAMQMQMASIGAQPGLTQSPAGMQRLMGLYDGLVNHGEAQHDFWGRWKQANPRTATGWEEDFRRKNPVEKFTVRAIIENSPNQAAKTALPQSIEWLRKNKDNPQEVAKFNKIYGNTASYFLTGKLDPYAGLQ